MRIKYLIMLVALGGCSWVSKDDFAARLPELDDDGDGVPASRDCDDNDADISPKKAETWYDGIDSDCAGDDDYDADKDGHVPTEYVSLETRGVRGTGILPGGDCNDLDANIFPDAVDAWYDGVDTDCAGDDDFDKDGDGHAIRDGEREYQPTEFADGTGNLAADDCDDDDPTVNPAAEDAWYDGIDSDCQNNDDFDKDGDGYYRTNEAFYGPTVYADSTAASPALPGDCDDEKADVNPSPPIADAWYDGVDSDCQGNDDFDQDEDGFVPSDYAGFTTTYVDPSGDLPGGDCNDIPSEGGVNANPGLIELLSDDIDHDCNGDDLPVADPPLDPSKTFRMDELKDSSYGAVHSVQWGESAEGIFLAIGAESNDVHAFGVIDVYTFDPLDPIYGERSSDIINEGTSDYDFSANMGFWVDEDVHISLTGSVRPGSGIRDLYIRGDGYYDCPVDEDPERRCASPTGAAGGPSLSSAGEDEWVHLQDVHILRDTFGDFHTVGCDDDNEVLQYNEATTTSLHIGAMAGENRFTSVGWVDNFSATQCAVFERYGEPVILSNRDGAFSARTFNYLSGDWELTSIDEDGLPMPDPRVLTADIKDILVPTARAPEPLFMVVDASTNSLLIIDQDFALLREHALPTTPRSVQALFGSDGTLYVMTVGEDGSGTIQWGEYGAPPVREIRLSVDRVRAGAMWIDDATNNILQVAAAVDDVTTDNDPLHYGVAYLTDGDGDTDTADTDGEESDDDTTADDSAGATTDDETDASDSSEGDDGGSATDEGTGVSSGEEGGSDGETTGDEDTSDGIDSAD